MKAAQKAKMNAEERRPIAPPPPPPPSPPPSSGGPCPPVGLVPASFSWEDAVSGSVVKLFLQIRRLGWGKNAECTEIKGERRSGEKKEAPLLLKLAERRAESSSATLPPVRNDDTGQCRDVDEMILKEHPY